MASLLGLEMGVPFLMPNWAWVGRRRKKESIVVRRKIDRSDLMVLVMVMVDVIE